VTTYYVSNRTDLGGAGTQGDPFACSEIWANASPADIFILQDGTYQGANAMMDTEAQSGTGTDGSVGNFITVKAENDGKAIIDGELVRNPLLLNNCDYWKFAGIDFANGGWQGNADGVVEIVGCNFTEMRRCVAYDGLSDTTSGSLFAPNNTDDVLLEDCAGFGHAQKGYNFINGGTGTSGGYGSGGCTARRCFSLIKSNQNTQPHTGFETHYFNNNCIWENLIGIWDLEADTPNVYGPLTGTGQPSVSLPCTIKLLGCIGIVLQSSFEGCIAALGTTHLAAQDFEIKDCVGYIESGPDHIGVDNADRGISLTGTTVSPDDFSATKLTTITNGGGNSLHADWGATEHETATSVAALAHTIFDDTGGAAI